MVVAGIDVGNKTVKAVILDDVKLFYSIIPSDEESAVTADRALCQALEKAGLGWEDITGLFVTGVEEGELSFASGYITEMTSAVRGAKYLFPSVRTVIDMGAETCVIATCDDAGRVIEYSQNQKCASGTGIFLEVMAEALEVDLNDLGGLALQSTTNIEITSTCAVFAESEVVSLVSTGTNKVDVLAGIHNSIASRTISMLKAVGFEEDVVMIGGVARNVGIVDALQKHSGLHILIPETPDIVGALGAAVMARERGARGGK